MIFFRNPHNYARELAEVGAYNVAWDWGALSKRKIDPVQWANLYFGVGKDWVQLVFADTGVRELRPGYTLDEPAAVYPVWDAEKDTFEYLEELCANPVGQDVDACTPIPGRTRKWCPVFGQPHIVALVNVSGARTRAKSAILSRVREIFAEYPEAQSYIHNTYSYKLAFEFFTHGDLDVRTNASKGKIYLPNGKEIIAERIQLNEYRPWIKITAMSVADLKIARNRCIYNIKSALWADENYVSNKGFRTRPTYERDADMLPVKTPVSSKRRLTLPLKVQPGDKVQCDVCSLARACKLYREGAVCAVPGQEMKKLADAFKTRDSSQIIDGLGQIMAVQVDRIQTALEVEEINDELDPQVSKDLKSLFDQGVKLAKLVDPTLNGGTKVQVNVGAAQQVAWSNPNELTRVVVQELEQTHKREEITQEMVEALLAKKLAQGTGQTIRGELA